MQGVSAAYVPALAALCQGCTRLQFSMCSLISSPECWHQLIQHMPSVTHITRWAVKSVATAAMLRKHNPSQPGKLELLSPRVIAGLRARTCKLVITLELPREQGSRLLAEVLGKLGICTAVEACKLSSLQGPSLAPRTPLDCSPSLAQCLVDSFPSLTSLALHGYFIPCSGLATLLSQPRLSRQLQQLDLSNTTITQAEQPDPEAATLDNLFNAARGLDGFRAALQPLAQLQVLTISTKLKTATWHREGLTELLQALP
ncbi:hypothetical protein QJQ45_010928 [Haematococcus lacustris]|nr:hypothetical protein QJQ45_010928 [Haematococcus lacustris]